MRRRRLSSCLPAGKCGPWRHSDSLLLQVRSPHAQKQSSGQPHLGWARIETSYLGLRCHGGRGLYAVARVYDLGIHKNRPFLVMEFIRGRNLGQHARAQNISSRHSALWMAKVAKALSVAHGRGVYHLDIKPENIVIDENGEPRIIDFGLARLEHAWEADSIEPGKVTGTILYMPPEKANGETDKLGPKSDIFALGAVLYSLLVGHAPFQGADFEECFGRAKSCDFNREALKAPEVPPTLARITLKAMEEKPERRYESAEELAGSLQMYLRRPLWIGWSVAAILVLVLVVCIAWLVPSNSAGDGQSGTRAYSAPTIKWAMRNKNGKLVISPAVAPRFEPSMG